MAHASSMAWEDAGFEWFAVLVACAAPPSSSQALVTILAAGVVRRCLVLHSLNTLTVHREVSRKKLHQSRRGTRQATCSTELRRAGRSHPACWNFSANAIRPSMQSMRGNATVLLQ